MRKIFDGNFKFIAVLSLITSALTWSMVNGAGDSAGRFALLSPDGLLVAHGPTVPPDPWDGVRIAHGPTVPPDPWDGVRIAHGPTVPPDPWDGVRVAA